MQRITVTLRLNACWGIVYHMNLMPTRTSSVQAASEKKNAIIFKDMACCGYDLQVDRSFHEGVHKWCVVDVRPTLQRGHRVIPLASQLPPRSRRARRAGLSRLGIPLAFHHRS
jgi:hypothetical protein